MFDSEPFDILLVEDDPEYARLLRILLKKTGMRFEMKHVTRLHDATTYLEDGENADVILLDLMLPDSEGLQTFLQMQAAAPEIPIILLTALDSHEMAVQAVKAGAQDYLVKGQADMHWLARSIRYAIERHNVQTELNKHIHRLALLRDVDDELTYRLNVDYVLMLALDAAVRLSSAHAGLIGLVEEGQVRLLQNINYAPQALTDFPLLEKGILARALKRRQPELVMDAVSDPDYAALRPKTRAQIALPLVSQNRLIGFLNLEANDPARFSPETFDFLLLLAARAATAVDNARLYQTSQAQLAELKQLYAQVSSLEQMKTDMIRLAAHDLRGPLSNMMGYVYLTRRALGDSPTEPIAGYLETIERSLARMQGITDDILSLERVNAIEQVALQTVSLPELVERAYHESQRLAEQKKQSFTLNVPPQPVIVQGEPALLLEAVANLIGNAIKYTPEKGCIKVRVDLVEKDALFEVQDTGFGIPSEQQGRLFQPFFRVQSDETASISGTGLGLNLVKNIVERHGGQMLFESTYGKGSLFGFRLPLVTGGRKKGNGK